MKTTVKRVALSMVACAVMSGNVYGDIGDINEVGMHTNNIGTVVELIKSEIPNMVKLHGNNIIALSKQIDFYKDVPQIKAYLESALKSEQKLLAESKMLNSKLLPISVLGNAINAAAVYDSVVAGLNEYQATKQVSFDNGLKIAESLASFNPLAGSTIFAKDQVDSALSLSRGAGEEYSNSVSSIADQYYQQYHTLKDMVFTGRTRLEISDKIDYFHMQQKDMIMRLNDMKKEINDSVTFFGKENALKSIDSFLSILNQDIASKQENFVDIARDKVKQYNETKIAIDRMNSEMKNDYDDVKNITQQIVDAKNATSNTQPAQKVVDKSTVKTKSSDETSSTTTQSDGKSFNPTQELAKLTTKADYEAFAKAHGKGTLFDTAYADAVREANYKIAQIDLDALGKNPTQKQIDAYKNTYSDNSYREYTKTAEGLRAAAIITEFNTLKNGGKATQADYIRFVNANKTNPNYATAITKANYEIAWIDLKAIQAKPTQTAIDAFLSKYADSSYKDYRDQAEGLRTEASSIQQNKNYETEKILAWINTKAKNTKEAYYEYFSKYKSDMYDNKATKDYSDKFEYALNQIKVLSEPQQFNVEAWNAPVQENKNTKNEEIKPWSINLTNDKMIDKVNTLVAENKDSSSTTTPSVDGGGLIETDGSLASLLQGHTYFVPVWDSYQNDKGETVVNNHVESLYFGMNNQLDVTWVENGENKKVALNYVIDGNKVKITGYDAEGASVNETLNLSNYTKVYSNPSSGNLYSVSFMGGEDRETFFGLYDLAYQSLVNNTPSSTVSPAGLANYLYVSESTNKAGITADFAIHGDTHIERATDNSITLPTGAEGFTNVGGNGDVLAIKKGNYDYVSWGSWGETQSIYNKNTGEISQIQAGSWVYASEIAKDLPQSGSATYNGQLYGDYLEPDAKLIKAGVVGGNIALNANFGTKNVTGNMNVTVEGNNWTNGNFNLPIQSTGGGHGFDGGMNVNYAEEAHIAGVFAGPSANEIAGSFVINHGAGAPDNGTVVGVYGAKK